MSANKKLTITEYIQNFKTPPAGNNPYTWWHWINGNITRDGITKELEWMKKIGIGGAIIFNVGILNDSLPRAVPFRSDQWWAMVEHAEKEADRLGLKIGIHNCDGWSHSGGPWVMPAESMKEIVSSETYITPGNKTIILQKPRIKENFYRDIAILAFPVKHADLFVSGTDLTSSLPNFKKTNLLDNDVTTSVEVIASKTSPANFTFSYNAPCTVASLSLRTGGSRIADFFPVEIEASMDGSNFKTIDQFESNSKGIFGWNTVGQGSTITLNFKKQTCKYLRIVFSGNTRFLLSDLYMSENNRINLWEAKSGQIHYIEHGGAPEYYKPDLDSWKADNSSSTVKKQAIIDLTQKLKAGDILDWQPKVGIWKIIRIGYTSTGKTTGPSTVEGRGLETDKLNPKLMEQQYNAFMGEVVKRAVQSNTKSMKYDEIDSWENGVQNWTDGFQDLFKQLRGYDMMPFLPVITSGQIVDSYEISERFLWDYRRTLADLIASSCFGHFGDVARKDSLKVFAEGAGRQQYLYDPINYSKGADIPKGEFWGQYNEAGANLKENPGEVSTMRPRVDCKVAASVAHIYGGNLVAAESFTARGNVTFEYGPYDLKMLGDKAFAMGINYMVFHTSVHQPNTVLKPGFTLGPFGSQFNPNNIIYENAGEWVAYLTRCQYLLRQGKFVADVCYFTSDNVPNYLGRRDELSVPLPEGYDYDGINSDIILNHMSVHNGRIVLDSGMEYQLLLLPNDDAIEPKVLDKISELVAAGATIVGPKPQRAHGLKGFPDVDLGIKTKADQVWGKYDGKNVKENAFGKGKVIWNKSFKSIFSEMALAPDFHYSGNNDKMEINYIHRRADDVDIYFVANGRYRSEVIIATFRVNNKTPYLFYPDQGKVVKSAQFTAKNGSIEMPLHLDPAGSVFVVFAPESKIASVIKSTNQNAEVYFTPDNKMKGEFFSSGKNIFTLSDGSKKTLDVVVPPSILTDENWDITFPQAGKRPISLKSSKLFKWNESANGAIKYFSGTATYNGSFTLQKEYIQKDIQLTIDLGNVRNLATIKINGHLCADLWKEPFRANITKYVLGGINSIEIEVTNTWTNRLIGDEQLPVDVKYTSNLISEFPVWMKDSVINRPSGRTTFTIWKFYEKGSKLVDAGLVGPVKINVSVIKTL